MYTLEPAVKLNFAWAYPPLACSLLPTPVPPLAPRAVMLSVCVYVYACVYVCGHHIVVYAGVCGSELIYIYILCVFG